MEEFELSLDNLKQELSCCFCNELVCDSYRFLSCSHIFCSRHKDTSTTKCFICHKGEIENVAKDDVVDQMVTEYKYLIAIYHNTKENIENVSDNTNTMKKTKPATPVKSKIISKKSPQQNVETKSSPIMKSNTFESEVNLHNSTTKRSRGNNDKKATLKQSAPLKKVSLSSNESIMNTSLSFSKAVKRNKKGETQLHLACVRNKMEDVKALLKGGASPNTKDNAGWTPLHEAVAGGHTILVELLLSYKAFPQVPGPHYETPLHEAVRLQYTEIAQRLVTAGASLHAKNDKGETPLALASDDIKKVLQATTDQSDHTRNFDVTLNIQNDDVFILLPSMLNKENCTKLQKLAKKHENVKVPSEFSNDVSHIVVESEGGSCRVTQETLLAVVSGKPIISSAWLSACNDTSLSNMTQYYISNLGGATECVHLSLMNKVRLQPGLFTGCHFYFIGFNSKYEISAHLTIKKQFLCQLIKEGGGTVLRREPNPESISESERILPYHANPGSALEQCAHYIIYQKQPVLAYKMKHIKSLPVGWLIECVQNFKLVDP